MALLSKLTALAAALTQIVTLSGQVQTALTDLDTFLGE
jgi:hypothetical protein